MRTLTTRKIKTLKDQITIVKKEETRKKFHSLKIFSFFKEKGSLLMKNRAMKFKVKPKS